MKCGWFNFMLIGACEYFLIYLFISINNFHLTNIKFRVCQQFAPEYKEIAFELKGIVNVGVINRDENETLKKKYLLNKFPTVFIFGLNKTIPVRLEGRRKPEEIVEKAMLYTKLLKGSSEEISSSESEEYIARDM